MSSHYRARSTSAPESAPPALAVSDSDEITAMTPTPSALDPSALDVEREDDLQPPEGTRPS
jgi:hypothetical protein